MDILVLGGNGYLGSKVIGELLKEHGHTVTCTVRPTSSLSRISSYLNDILLIPASLDAVKTATKYTSFDTVFNMSCSYGKESTLFDNVIEANIDFPLSVLNCVAETGCRRFLTIGTGLPDYLNMYSFSKKQFSEFGRYYAYTSGIDFINLKLQMFYGADEPSNRFIPRLILDMLNGDDINVTLGTQHRDIIAVSDVIQAVLGSFHSSLCGYQEIPVGTGIAPTISELVDFIWQNTGKRSHIHKGIIPMRKNEPDCVADLTRLRAIMNWQPIHWQQGIAVMIEQLRNRLRN